LPWYKKNTSPTEETCRVIRSDKDSHDLKASVVYKIPKECRALYIGETGSMIEEHTKTTIETSDSTIWNAL
jgi:hypothetical protein